ncbi:hypothetical protein AN958_07203 [Leucoagaricus sp. SymC.cos]|nr:hypothetical protein AN958_07203 [Leucoagaricus sp. SymC.cos]
MLCPTIGPDTAFGHEFPGRIMRATNAERTEPNEKKTDSAVTRYCFSLGMCSRRSVPSVGMEPCRSGINIHDVKWTIVEVSGDGEWSRHVHLQRFPRGRAQCRE